MKTTSYRSLAAQELITGLVRTVNPQRAIEIGTQQGNSALLICKGMKNGTSFSTYDLFQERYGKPPYLETHARKDIAEELLRKAPYINCAWNVFMGNHKLALEHLETEQE